MKRFLVFLGFVLCAFVAIRFAPHADAQFTAPALPGTFTDIATPGTKPPSGATSVYTKAGTLCALNPSGTETCTGSGGSSSPSALAFQYINTAENSPGSCSGSVFAYTGFAALATPETVTFSLTATATVLIDYRAQLSAAGSSGTFGTVAVIDSVASSIQSAISISSGFVGRDVYATQVSLGSGSHTIAMQHCGTASIQWQSRSLVIDQL